MFDCARPRQEDYPYLCDETLYTEDWVCPCHWDEEVECDVCGCKFYISDLYTNYEVSGYPSVDNGCPECRGNETWDYYGKPRLYWRKTPGKIIVDMEWFDPAY